MSIVLNSSGGGSITIAEPSTASNLTATLPAGTGTIVVAGQNSAITAGTAQTASGSSVDFTSIPSWVKRITVQIVNLGYAAAGAGVIRIGSGSLTTSGYLGSVTGFSTTPAITYSSVTNGLSNLTTNAASGTTTITGQMVITNVTGNLWVATSCTTRNGDSVTNLSNSYITLSGELDRLSLVATTSTFNAGTINILYE